MASFPDNLPPEGLNEIYKLLIYFGILYILTTAITSWIITRRRSFPKAVEVPAEQVEPQMTETAQAQPMIGISNTLSFDDTQDRLSSMKIEVEGAQAALVKLKELQKNEQLSPEAYMKLSSRYNDLVNKIKSDMNVMIQSDIETSSGEIDTGITVDEMESIEADLEQQLMDLDNDDSFLKKRPKKKIGEIFGEDQAKQEEVQPRATPPVTPVATPPRQPEEKKRVPMPPPPKKSVSSPPPPTSSSSAAAPPKPTADKSSMVPPPPKKAQAPPPPTSSSSAATPPKATPPAAPRTNQPLSAAQPMKVETEDDDSMFAKSTSIAALRMDMLRELARLKKLIPEDQDKDQ